MSPASTAATAPPWADLLPELCDLVTERLDPISILRFPAVCRGWSAACGENPRQLRPGAPTLLTSGLDPDGCENECDVDAGKFGLHDVSAGCGRRKSFLGEAEGLKRRTWVGGKDGWLVTTDRGCDIELLNPVTGARVHLPSFATIGAAKVPEFGYLRVRTGGGGGQYRKILKVTLCRTPAHPDGHLAVALFSEGLLAFTAAGGEGRGARRWTVLKNPAGASWADVSYSYMDAIVLDGKLFAVNMLGGIYFWDMDGGDTAEPVVVQGPETDHEYDDDHHRCAYYLAASDGGGGHQRLMLIYIHGYDVGGLYKYGRKCSWDSRVGTRLVFDDKRSFRELGMSLHELDAGSGTWRRVADLGGDRALFLGANYPFYVTVRRGPGFEDDAGLETDCVYLADTPYGYDVAILGLAGNGEGGDGYVMESFPFSLVAEPLQMPMWFVPTDYPH